MMNLSKYRVIDLSQELIPGEHRIDGHYLHGEPAAGRPIEVQEYTAYGARMHAVQGHTHCGTHTEAFYKYAEDGADLAAMPIESYLGEAAACNFTTREPGAPISAGDLAEAGVRSGDIVLAWGNEQPPEAWPHLAAEAVDWLVATGIKLLAIERIHFNPPGIPWGTRCGDARLLLAGIPIVDSPAGLNQITRDRVFFIGLPVKLRRATAMWTRAIALEEIDASAEETAP